MPKKEKAIGSMILKEYTDLNVELSSCLSENIDEIFSKISDIRKGYIKNNNTCVSHLESSCELYLSNYYFAKGDIELCLNHANLCLEHALKSGISIIIWNAYHLLSHWYCKLGRFNQAIRYCIEEFKILDNIELKANLFLCYSKIRLAEIYINEYRPRAGMKYLDDVMALSVSLDEPNRLVLIGLEENFRIDCLEAMGENKKVIQKCLEIQKFGVLNEAKSFIGMHLANAYLNLGNYKKAQHYIKNTKDIMNSQWGIESDKIEIEIMELQIEVAKGKVENLKYLEAFTKKIPSRFSGDKDTLLINKSMRRAYKALAFGYEIIGDTPKTLHYEREMKRLEDDIRSEENIELLEELRITLDGISNTKKNSKKDFTQHKLLRETYLLSPRELEVAWSVREGFTNKEISSKLNITEKSVNESKRRISHKLKIEGRGMLRNFLLKLG